MLVAFSSIFVADTKIIFDYNFVGPLKKLKNQFLYDGVQKVVIRTCHIIECSCTLYIDIFTVEMEVSLKKKIASRG